MSQTVLMLQSGHEYVVEMAFFNVQRAITPEVCNPELRFLCSACRLMVLNICVKEYNPELRFLHSAHRPILLNICVKFHENILNGFEVTERTRVCGADRSMW